MRVLATDLQDEGLEAEHELGKVVLQVVLLDIASRDVVIELFQG
jgi:hypothetical protein